ncbi:hypothetical protein [Nocardioides sp. SYSU DS0651]|uniref:hypothetical protein n=1 Tax=Nocardioides sp. SYSU DS0651 TaxID=3415955 RepID=UPI003F4B77FF
MGTSTRPGDVLAGRYRLIDLLSESGGGRFWRAHDAVLERYVALHVIAEDDPRAPMLVEAARTSATVLDSRILRVLDAATEGGRCFVVNEWGTGISLDILVTHAGPLGPRRAAWLVADVAGAIAQAHARGVAHGRLNPENVLIDSFGAVRIIGLCVDAALHGLPPSDIDTDVEDLGGLLYCALTGTWPGPSGSIVPAAPRENDAFLSPRQVVAGVPKPLDALWREFDCPGDHSPGRRRWREPDHPDVSSAQAIANELLAFVGDPTGMPERLAASIPPINELRPVWLTAVADPAPHDSTGDIPVVAPAAARSPHGTTRTGEPETGGAQSDGAQSGAAARSGEPVRSAASAQAAQAARADASSAAEHDLPTEPGMPVFGDEDGDVEWLRTRATPPPPPPPFEDPPERPLFAPDPPDGVAARRARAGAGHTEVRSPGGPPTGGNGVVPGGYWPFDHDPGDQTAEHEEVPGRSWLRLAMAFAVALLLLVAVAVAFNLGRGRTVLGGDPDDEPTPAPSASASQAPVLSGITATDLDPLGDGEEHAGEAANLVDGDPATTWSTQTYEDQLGPPPGLKTGVGVVLDLGRTRQVSAVEVQAGEGRTRLALHAADAPPTAAPTRAPVATATGSGRLVLAPEDSAGAPTAVSARYLVLWLTSLPEVDGDFRAELSEVVVRGR